MYIYAILNWCIREGTRQLLPYAGFLLAALCRRAALGNIMKERGRESMGLATFIGGIHPYEGKELSENKPVQVLMPKGDLVYPMS